MGTQTVRKTADFRIKWSGVLTKSSELAKRSSRSDSYIVLRRFMVTVGSERVPVLWVKGQIVLREN